MRGWIQKGLELIFSFLVIYNTLTFEGIWHLTVYCNCLLSINLFRFFFLPIKPLTTTIQIQLYALTKCVLLNCSKTIDAILMIIKQSFYYHEFSEMIPLGSSYSSIHSRLSGLKPLTQRSIQLSNPLLVENPVSWQSSADLKIVKYVVIVYTLYGIIHIKWFASFRWSLNPNSAWPIRHGAV